MSDHTAKVRAVEPIVDFRAAVPQYREKLSDHIQLMVGSVSRQLEAIQNTVASHRRDLETAVAELANAEAELSRCENDCDPDEGSPDCSSEEEAVAQARVELRRAQAAYDVSRDCLQTMEFAIAAFRPCKARLDALVRSELPAFQAALDRTIYNLTQVLSVRTPMVTTAPDAFPSPGAPGPASSPNWSASLGLTERRGEAVDAGSDTGVVLLATSELPLPSEVHGEADFLKIPAEDIRSGVQKLPEIIAGVQAGADRDHWRDLDRQLGLSGARGYLAAYEAFYGDRPVIVERDESGYRVVSGRHRVWMAKQCGLSRLPVRLVDTSGGPGL